MSQNVTYITEDGQVVGYGNSQNDNPEEKKDEIQPPVYRPNSPVVIEHLTADDISSDEKVELFFVLSYLYS